MDDEEGLRMLVRRFSGWAMRWNWRRTGRRPSKSSGREVSRPFDAVLLDLTVRAGLGGREAVQALLKIDPTVKAIVMSGNASDPVMLEPERHGFQGVLTKPFDFAELQKTLGRVMESGLGSVGAP
jgi:CheY-like chemotaxis protein